MKQKETERMLLEANTLISQSPLAASEKDNLRKNIKHFISSISKEDNVAGCKWEWFDFEDDGHGVNLLWNGKM